MHEERTDPRESLLVARTLADLGKISDARAVLVAGLRLARDVPADFQAMVQELGTLCERMHDVAGALSCAWHAADPDRTEALAARACPRDQARSLAQRAGLQAEGRERRSLHTRAADQFARDRRVLHAAEQWDQAGMPDRARMQWQAVAARARRLPYVEGLCLVQDARAAWRMSQSAEASVDRAVQRFQWLAALHSRHGRFDVAAGCHALVMDLAERGGRDELVRASRRAFEEQMNRYDGGLSGMPEVRRLVAVGDELCAWENGFEIAEHTADWMTLGTRVSPALALELRLLALETEGKPAGAVVYALSRLAHGLGEVGPEALGPLGVLSRRRTPAVRVAVARSLGLLPSPRSLRALTQALRDPDPEVVEEATRSIAKMTGPEVVGGLLSLIGQGSYGGNIRRDATLDATRRAAFAALAGTREAKSLVSWILEHGGRRDRRLMEEVVSRTP